MRTVRDLLVRVLCTLLVLTGGPVGHARASSCAHSGMPTQAQPAGIFVADVGAAPSAACCGTTACCCAVRSAAVPDRHASPPSLCGCNDAPAPDRTPTQRVPDHPLCADAVLFVLLPCGTVAPPRPRLATHANRIVAWGPLPGRTRQVALSIWQP